MFLTPSAPKSRSLLPRMSRSRFLRRYVGHPYRLMLIWIWKHLLVSFASWRPVRAYGVHLHSVMQLAAKRQQLVSTYFFRNRPELELLVRLLGRRGQGSLLNITVVGCSKGAEVYSFSYAIRCAQADMKINLYAVDISKDILDFAEAGVYSLRNDDGLGIASPSSLASGADVVANTFKDQFATSIFERMSPEEIKALFDRYGDQVRVKPRFREGITWHCGDARDPSLVRALGPQDIVVANRFLCHMPPEEAEGCLRNLAQLVKPCGYLFVSGVDLDVRSKVARELGWKPITELICEIHEGDQSVRHSWPLEYSALEPLDQGRAD
jgi:chemotaxis methyl-accepting protein methylase